MKNRMLIFTFIVIVLFLTIWDLAAPDRYFSENENRILAQKPKFSAENFFSGEYTGAYENYVTDQFAGRDKWIQLKTGTEKAIGEVLINGVYLGKEDTLFRQYLSAQAGGAGGLEENAEKKLDKLQDDVKEYRQICEGGQVKVMLVPSSAMVWQEKLPPYAAAGQFSEAAFLERGNKNVWIDVLSTLSAHKDESIYYRTDHHWTTLGAYYGYTAWAQSMGIESVPIEAFKRETVSDSFQGTLQSRLNLPQAPDTIELFLPKEEKRYEVIYDLGDKSSDSLYEKRHLETKNQYGVFLDDNHGLIEIRVSKPGQNEIEPQEVSDESTEVKNRSIAVIKDSYANCFVPFLTEHYETVFVIDKRYYRGKIGEFLEENDVNDVLFLYQITGFIENY